MTAITNQIRRYVLDRTSVLMIPALVDPELLKSAPVGEREIQDRRVMVVVGGGSIGDRGLASGSMQIVDAVVRCADRMPQYTFYVLPGIGLDQTEQSWPVNMREVIGSEGILRWMMACPVLIGRAGRSTVAEALALRKRSVLIPVIGANLWRAAEQQHNAEVARSLSPAVVVLEPDRLDELERSMTLVTDSNPVSWTAGNDYLLELLSTHMC